jgi:hypothetical protein
MPGSDQQEGEMTAALVGLGGAVFGALAALVGAVLADRRQARAEAGRWRRDQLESAYAQALRYLLRAANRRSEFVGGSGSAVLRREHQREWFDDLVEAQVWMRTVTRYCGATQAIDIRQAAEQLDSHVDRLISGVRYDAKSFSIWKVLQSCIATVTECARLDGSGTAISVSASQKTVHVTARADEHLVKV